MVEQKKIIWNSSNVAYFWTSYLNNSSKHGVWMSEGSGKSIKKRMKKILPKRFLSTPKSICDWGCGTGNFAKSYAAKGHKVFALDQKEIVSQIPQGLNNLIGLSDSTVIHDCSLDLVYALEVIEHIIDSEMKKTFSEWRRILKKDGYLLLTTPNDEDLDSNSIVCPNCETQFHSVQHVRSLSTNSISVLMAENGFVVEKIWLGEFFFATQRGIFIETLRKVWFTTRRVQESQNKNLKQPHMMMLSRLK
jgi:2-polyprenyl-3-methyl-5-hydroxy-6-metoxy-1,4-benzoquinol methylase